MGIGLHFFIFKIVRKYFSIETLGWNRTKRRIDRWSRWQSASVSLESWRHVWYSHVWYSTPIGVLVYNHSSFLLIKVDNFAGLRKKQAHDVGADEEKTVVKLYSQAIVCTNRLGIDEILERLSRLFPPFAPPDKFATSIPAPAAQWRYLTVARKYLKVREKNPIWFAQN